MECCDQTETSSTVSFPTLPRMLIFRLGRFTTLLTRIDVYFPTVYTLDCFCDDCVDLEPGDPARHVYKLCAMIMHAGALLERGYHMTYARLMDGTFGPPDDKRVDKCCALNLLPSVVQGMRDPESDLSVWLKCDGDNIVAMSEMELNFLFTASGRSLTPYILTYYRIN